jgi:hypothetical protein
MDQRRLYYEEPEPVAELDHLVEHLTSILADLDVLFQRFVQRSSVKPHSSSCVGNFVLFLMHRKVFMSGCDTLCN